MRARAAAALLAALLLAGCAGGGDPDIAAPAPPVAAPHLADGAIVAEDGARLPLRRWLPDGPVKATVLALHGFNDYSNAFTGPAEEWAKHGIATYAYDQRGFGLAPDHGYWVGTWRLDQDLALASRLVAARHPGVPHYLLGESMGGAVVMTAVTGAAGAARPVDDGIILSAPAVWGRQVMNIFERTALWAADTILPAMTVTGQGLNIKASDNIEMLRALSRDPLLIKATRIDTVEGLVDLMTLALDAAPRLDGPALVLYGEHDEIIPPDAMRRMVAALPPADAAERRLAFYANGYHMLLRDLEGPLVERDVASWIANHAAALPSGADNLAVARLSLDAAHVPAGG